MGCAPASVSWQVTHLVFKVNKIKSRHTYLPTPTQQQCPSNRSNMPFKVSAPGRYKTPVMIQSTADVIGPTKGQYFIIDYIAILMIIIIYIYIYGILLMIQSDLQPSIHTFKHRLWSQPCRATVSSSGAVKVRCLLRDPTTFS